MRALALLAVLLLLPAAAAQPEFANPHQVRIAHGDIPTTNLVEDDGVWNFQELFVVAENESIEWTVPAGHSLTGTGCDGCSSTADGSAAPTYNLTCTNADGGSCAITVNHATTGAHDAFGASVDLREGSIVVLYTRAGIHATAAVEPTVEFNCASVPDCTLRQYNTDSLDRFWFNVAPVAPDTEVVAPAPESGFGILELLIGLAAGIALWYVLVNQGLVQKRQRKQIAGEAAHKAVAKTEDKATLEGRKRVLMAALKELEVAKMKQEMDTEVYDALKADFKKETVTVMRALEESA